MPLTHFLGLIALVILAAGLTLWLAFYSGLPLVALGFAALAASLILTWTRVSR
jgi:membrane protein implicated in regulation of membrane protease activity